MDEVGGRFTGIDEVGGRFTGISGSESEVIGIDRLLVAVAVFVTGVATRVLRRVDHRRVTISKFVLDRMIRSEQLIDRRL